MRSDFLVLACLVCAGHARRLAFNPAAGLPVDGVGSSHGIGERALHIWKPHQLVAPGIAKHARCPQRGPCMADELGPRMPSARGVLTALMTMLLLQAPTTEVVQAAPSSATASDVAREQAIEAQRQFQKQAQAKAEAQRAAAETARLQLIAQQKERQDLLGKGGTPKATKTIAEIPKVTKRTDANPPATKTIDEAPKIKKTMTAAEFSASEAAKEETAEIPKGATKTAAKPGAKTTAAKPVAKSAAEKTAAKSVQQEGAKTPKAPVAKPVAKTSAAEKPAAKAAKKEETKIQKSPAAKPVAKTSAAEKPAAKAVKKEEAKPQKSPAAKPVAKDTKTAVKSEVSKKADYLKAAQDAVQIERKGVESAKKDIDKARIVKDKKGEEVAKKGFNKASDRLKAAVNKVQKLQKELESAKKDGQKKLQDLKKAVKEAQKTKEQKQGPLGKAREAKNKLTGDKIKSENDLKQKTQAVDQKKKELETLRKAGTKGRSLKDAEKRLDQADKEFAKAKEVVKSIASQLKDSEKLVAKQSGEADKAEKTVADAIEKASALEKDISKAR